MGFASLSGNEPRGLPPRSFVGHGNGILDPPAAQTGIQRFLAAAFVLC